MKYSKLDFLAAFICAMSAAPASVTSAQQATPQQLSTELVLEIIDPGIDHVKHLMKYSIQVFRDGGAIFYGEDSSGTLKTIRFAVPLERLAEIERKAEALGIHRLNEKYEDVLGERNKTITVAFAQGKSQKVEFGLRRAPIEIFEFLKVLNDQIGIERFRCPRMIQNIDECANERKAFDILYKRRTAK